MPIKKPSEWEDGNDIEYFRRSPTGRVHVLKCFLHPLGEPQHPIEAAAFSSLGSLCGVSGLMGERYYLGQFADSDLCWRCVKAVPEAQRSMLFDRVLNEEI